jgi:16S rRNA pseudouridine516 synthase
MSKLSLDRILQAQGFGTRKYCRALIEDGEVRIGGDVQTEYRSTVDTSGLVLQVFDEEWVYREHVYIALNKPANVECSRKPSHHPGVLTLLPEQFTWRDVQPVGRLDHDTTGMLLMSDDGPFIHAQSSPKRHVPKIYQNHCRALHRSAIGTLTLEALGLAEGEWCYLDPAQLAMLAPA